MDIINLVPRDLPPAILNAESSINFFRPLWRFSPNKVNCLFIFRTTYQMIRLQNPTDESLVLTPHCSNPANFSLELDNTQQILLPSGGLLEIPLKFTPSAIGQMHSAEISFQCPQVSGSPLLCVISTKEKTFKQLSERTFLISREGVG